MLGTAQANTLGPKVNRIGGIKRVVSIGANLQATHGIRVSEDTVN